MKVDATTRQQKTQEALAGRIMPSESVCRRNTLSKSVVWNNTKLIEFAKLNSFIFLIDCFYFHFTFHFFIFLCFFFSIGKTAFNFIWKIKILKQKIKHKLTFIFIEKIVFLKFFCVIFLQFLCENVWLIEFFFVFLWFSLKNLHVI